MTSSKPSSRRLSYKTAESCRQVAWMRRHVLTNGGVFRGEGRENCLADADSNLFCDIRDEVVNYFHTEGISFWSGRSITNHTLSSQVQCLNFLFAIRKDRELVSQIARKLLTRDDLSAVEIHEKCHGNVGYISFEVTSAKDHLNEKTTKRGANCTSVDALIVAEDGNGRRTLIPIEWKYTESYDNADKSQGSSGKTRQDRYSKLIAESDYLNRQSKIFYFEPFYQLMRQTLWSEQMIKHKATEHIKADDYMHIHVIPPENKQLLYKNYKCAPGKSMAKAWMDDGLNDKGRQRYRIVSQSDILDVIEKNGKYAKLVEYLRDRYVENYD